MEEAKEILPEASEDLLIPKEDPYSHDLIMKLLSATKHTTLEHAPCRTSEESAKARGVSLSSGAKAMVLRDKASLAFFLAVMSASKKLSWKLLRAASGMKKLDLAKPEEVLELTKCIPGAVPPFGSVWGIQTFLDESLVE